MKIKWKMENGKWKIIILIGIALLLGIAILNQQKTKSSPQPTPSPSTAPKLISSSLTDEEHIYKIPSQGDLKIKAQFKYGAGDYGYVCKGSGLVGFVHVT